ncbi:hypothetical protein RNJ44_03129 [Nakaseomyces bracarensis]|uniref:NADH dehydrogenase subunit 2 n=1 Tax=Nakaseomyces bracarensis TaxID=273131 RepID=A0ABR4NYW5_9SACH
MFSALKIEMTNFTSIVDTSYLGRFPFLIFFFSFSFLFYFFILCNCLESILKVPFYFITITINLFLLYERGVKDKRVSYLYLIPIFLLFFNFFFTSLISLNLVTVLSEYLLL